jgi:hypothetical protein
VCGARVKGRGGLVVLLLALMASGCLSGSAATEPVRGPPTGRLEGLVVTKGGLPGAALPVKDALVVVTRTTSSRGNTLTFKTDDEGRFKAQLPAGRYTIRTLVYPTYSFSVLVIANQVVHARLVVRVL